MHLAGAGRPLAKSQCLCYNNRSLSLSGLARQRGVRAVLVFTHRHGPLFSRWVSRFPFLQELLEILFSDSEFTTEFEGSQLTFLDIAPDGRNVQFQELGYISGGQKFFLNHCHLVYRILCYHVIL